MSPKHAPDGEDAPASEPSATSSAESVPRPRWRRWLVNLGIVGLSTFLALVVVDVALNLLGIPPEQEGHQERFVEHDVRRGWRNVPGASGWLETDEYRIRLEYNSAGFRGPEVQVSKPEGVFRVLLLGDSFVEGYTVELEERVSEVLQERLRAAGGPTGSAEVIALGTAGYATDQQLIWLEDEGLAYEPDLVIAFFHPNDVWYNTRTEYSRGQKPRFQQDGDSLILTNVPVPLPDETARDQGGLYGWIRANSKLYWLIADVIKRSPRLHGLAVRIGLAAIPPEMVFDEGDAIAIPAEFTVYREVLGSEQQAAWFLTNRLFDRMSRSVEAAGADFLAFYVPLRGSVYTQELAVRSRFGLSAEGWDPRLITQRFTVICETRRIDCLDPTDRFLAAADSLAALGERLYFRNDWHWNALGHRLAGEILAARTLAKLEP